MDLVAGALKQSSHHNQLVHLYWIARYDYQPNWAFREHIHDFAQIIYITEGGGEAYLVNRPVKLEQGVILFMAPGVPHSLRSGTTQMLRTIDVKFAITPGEFCDTVSSIHTEVRDVDNRVLHVLMRTHEEAIKNQPGHFQLCNALMTEAMVLILREALGNVANEIYDPQQPLDDALVQRARDLIQERYAESITLAELADMLGVSQQYLARRYKKVMGSTVHEYLLQYRIHQAKELMRTAEAPIKQIAFDVGFKSVHHFTRIFSRLEHMPPAAWRERQSGIGRHGITVSPGFVAVDVTVDDRSNEFVGL